MTTADLNVLDELYLHLDRDDEPWRPSGGWARGPRRRAASLETEPPFAAVLAHHPGGDAIMLNLSHAAGDGMSAVRLIASFLRAYAGVEDPVAAVDPREVRDVGRLVHSRSITARLARVGTLVEQTARLRATVDHTAP